MVPTLERITLTGVFEPDEDGWIQARVLEIPGVITCARTMDEAREMLADAAREMILSYVEEAQGTEETNGARYETIEVALK